MSDQTGTGKATREHTNITGPSSAEKFKRMRLANEEIQEKQERIRTMKNFGGCFNTVQELMNAHREKK